MQRGRRRRRGALTLRIGVLIAILAWLGIRVGDGLAPTDDVEPSDRPAAAGGAGPSTGAPDGEGASGAATRPPDPIEVERRAAIADRLWGCLRAIAADDLDRAFEAVEVAVALDLDDAQRARLREASSGLDRRIAEQLRDALERIRTGEVLASVDRLEPAFATARSEVRALLSAAFQSVTLPVPVPGPAAEIAAPRPLQRGTAVRARSGDAIADGQVVDARGGEVTVRVRNESGLVFPTLPRTAVEPQEADAAVAVDQAVAALRAGDRLLGAAWLLRARELGADPGRIAELGELLSR